MRAFKRFVVTSGIAVSVATTLILLNQLAAQQTGPSAQAAAVKVNANAIGGVVASPKGPEAGVWVIAETTDLPTRYIKEVVTDDQGRFVLPDLPKANYTVFARGYGLVDSPKVKAGLGAHLDLKPTVAPDKKTAAQLYPANYWYALLKVPEKNEFPGTGPKGNGIASTVGTQGQWLHLIKTDSCESCHQLGNAYTRTIPDMFKNLDSPALQWRRRVQSGQAGSAMLGGLAQLGPERATAEFGDWTTRIAKGELPAEAPPRPQGLERNVVITQWDWADPKSYLHDEIATDKRNPGVNANGLIYGSPEESRDTLPVLDPVHHTISTVKVPYRDPATPPQPKPLAASPIWGEESIWDSHTTVHNPMFDAKGRVWYTGRIRPADNNPDFCKAGSSHPSAKVTPLDRSGRQLGYYDPATKKSEMIDTCFATHHLLFAEDANDTLWTSSGGGGGVVGWLNTKLYDQTHDAAKSQGWTALVLDTNGNGKRDKYLDSEQKVLTAPSGESLGTSAAVAKVADKDRDTRLNAAFYGLAIGTDGTVWGSVLGFPGGIVRLTPGANPSETALAEYFEVPYNNPKAPVWGYSPRGMDIDRNNVAWVVLGSGHLASFDRRKCKGPLNGPSATGQHCPEGWTLYPSPGPNFKNVKDSGSADSHYYNWVDQFDTLGLGKNVPIATGNSSDSLLALVNGKWVVLRVPYPLGFFAKGMDGRIDDPKAGWKGKGVWTTWGTRTPFHSETGKGTMSKVVHFQMRPDPLAN
jgi:hypothetical protein